MSPTPSTPTPPPRRGRGQPRGEPTRQIRVYAADADLLPAVGPTAAQALRRLLRGYTAPPARTPRD